MAFPFKTGGDFYNCEALNMRLHNHGADLNEYGTGTIYFNTGSNTNHSKHAVVHDGTNFKALAFVDEIATNAEFLALKEKVDLLIGDDVDTDTIIDSWKEVQAFLKDIEDTKTLQGMLSNKVDKVDGKGLSTNDFTDALLTKLNGIEAGAEVNVQPDWNATSGNASIKNKPTIATFMGASSIGSTSSYIYWDGAKWATKALGSLAFKDSLAASDIPNLNWSKITSGKPTTLQGYGITDAYTKTEADALYANYLPLGGTAAAAQKLQTKRSLWGQEFDGTGNVNGSLYFAQGQAAMYAKVSGINDNLLFLQVNPEGNMLLGQYLAKNGKDVRFYGNNIGFCYGTAGTSSATAMLINSSGNVLIGTTTDNGNMFQVAQGASFGGSVNIANTLYLQANNNYIWGTTAYGKIHIGIQDAGSAGSSNATLSIYSDHIRSGDRNNAVSLGLSNYRWSNVYTQKLTIGNGSYNAVFQIDASSLALNRELKFTNIAASDISSGIAAAFKTSLAQVENLIASSIILGSSSGSASSLGFSIKKYTSIANTAPAGLETLFTVDTSGNVHIKGDLVVDGEVSAGGAGEEGASGSGGAEVLTQTLTSGGQTYTIPNTIARTDIAVSLYEWNGTGNSWDMCLADISVKADVITVTFGSTTTVNHKLVAIG